MLHDSIEKTLIDVTSNTRILEWSEAAPDHSWRVTKTVLHGGRQEGVDLLEVDNGVLSFRICPTRGMGLWDGQAGDVRLGWDSPVSEIVHPQFVELGARGGLGWLEGFGEWLNRCGLASIGSPGIDQVRSNTGELVPVQLTLHGKEAYLPASHLRVTVEPGDAPLLTVHGVVNETMVFGTQLRLITEISTRAGSNTLTIRDRIENIGGVRQEFQLLYHTNFGPPLLEEGSRFHAPVARITPRDDVAAADTASWDVYEGPVPGFREQVFFLEPLAGEDGATEVLLHNRTADRGIAMRFSVEQLPCLTLWKNTQATEDGYVTGIEPGTSYPNMRGFEREYNRVPHLAAGETYESTIKLKVLLNNDEVTDSLDRIDDLQGNTAALIEPDPADDLSP